MRIRRCLLAAGLAAGAGLPAVAQPATSVRQRPQPVSKTAARYQDRPLDIYSCGLCAVFIPPNACKAVIGEVSRDGWCALFELID
jgi:hypothetical protein